MKIDGKNSSCVLHSCGLRNLSQSFLETLDDYASLFSHLTPEVHFVLALLERGSAVASDR